MATFKSVYQSIFFLGLLFPFSPLKTKVIEKDCQEETTLTVPIDTKNRWKISGHTVGMIHMPDITGQVNRIKTLLSRDNLERLNHSDDQTVVLVVVTGFCNSRQILSSIKRLQTCNMAHWVDRFGLIDLGLVSLNKVRCLLVVTIFD